MALDGVDLEVGEGEVRGLLGPNGAGKTTLLRALFGLVRPDSGSIELLGNRRGDRLGTPVERVAGFVEDPAFYPYLSARANLELLAALDDIQADAVREVLDRVDLTARARDRVSGFSTGMRQRLGIAASLLRAPRLLLLDEPTSGLDPAGIRSVSRLIRELSGDGVAVLLSSHLIGELELTCDSYTIVAGGRVLWDGDAAHVEEDAPGAVYLLRTTDDAHAIALARSRPDLAVAPAGERPGVRLVARAPALDAYAIALGRDGIGVRRLELLVSPLESLFFSLTEAADSTEATAAV
jgi:ABC-2 type transport system ATP-binding protein